MNFQKVVDYFVMDEIKRNPLPLMLGLALLGMVLGTFLYDHSNSYIQIIGKVSLTLSSALIGAGVFSVLSQTVRYTEFIQGQLLHVFERDNFKNIIKQQIHDDAISAARMAQAQQALKEVFLDPQSITDDVVSFEDRWRMITESRLKGVLPNLHQDATVLLNKQFFNSELEYHFDNYSQTYDIKVNDNGIATIQNTFKAIIVKNNATQTCTFKQQTSSLTCTSGVELLELEIDGKRVTDQVDIDNYFTQASGTGSLNIDLKKYPDKPIRFKRVFKYQQDLKKEPHIIASISRYIKGGQLKVRVSGGFTPTFFRSGFYSINKHEQVADNPLPDADGFRKWLLASSGNLLLPGQGFVVILTPNQDTVPELSH